MKTTYTCRGAATLDSPSAPVRPRTVAFERDARTDRQTQSLPTAPGRRGFASAVLNGGVPKTTTDAFTFNDLPDAVLLGWLTSAGHRPNVLIECGPSATDTAMRHLMTWCALPFRYCAVPGKLELPTIRRGTLLLHDVAALTLAQQVALYDWMSQASGDMQVVSLTTTPLARLVESGEFLEGLYYRLNVIRLDAANGTRPAPLDTWQHAASRMA